MSGWPLTSEGSHQGQGPSDLLFEAVLLILKCFEGRERAERRLTIAAKQAAVFWQARGTLCQGLTVTEIWNFIPSFMRDPRLQSQML